MDFVLSANGPHVWHWPGAPHAVTDASAVIADLVHVGAVGVVAQWGLGAADWCVRHAAEFAAANLQVTVGLGMDGSHTVDQYVHAIVDAIDRVGRCGLDWEAVEKWESSAGHALAKAIVDGVLARRPDAADHVVDFPWWAPLSMPNGGGSHAHAPTREFGRLCGHERYPQCYGAAQKRYGETPQGVVGRSSRYLAWARDPSQYPSLGFAADRIFPAWQMYARTKQDHVTSLLAERRCLLWDLDEMDGACHDAMVDVRRLRALGYDGVDAVKAFQKAAGLVVDGICGDRTSAALAAASP